MISGLACGDAAESIRCEMSARRRAGEAALAARLQDLTGVKWKILTEDAEGEATLAERRKASEEAERAAILETPIVKAAFEAFPDAILENWNKEASA